MQTQKELVRLHPRKGLMNMDVLSFKRLAYRVFEDLGVQVPAVLDDIDVIINQVAEEKNISLSDDDRQLLQDLLEEIADQNYNYEDMKETLERVEQNVNNTIDDSQVIGSDDSTAQDAAANTEQTETPETLAPDSILKNTDESALGDNVSFDATDSSALEQTEAQQTEAAQSETTPSGEFDITTSDNYSESENTTEAQTETATEASSETAGTDGSDLVTV